jgi:hypothetical protein
MGSCGVTCSPLPCGDGEAPESRERRRGDAKAPRLLPEPGASEGEAQGPCLCFRPGPHAEDSEELRDALLSAVLLEEAFPAEEDEYGQRYMLDFEMSTEAGSASVRSGWIVRSREDFPRFTTCWVL